MASCRSRPESREAPYESESLTSSEYLAAPPTDTSASEDLKSFASLHACRSVSSGAELASSFLPFLLPADATHFRYGELAEPSRSPQPWRSPRSVAAPAATWQDLEALA